MNNLSIRNAVKAYVALAVLCSGVAGTIAWWRAPAQAGISNDATLVLVPLAMAALLIAGAVVLLRHISNRIDMLAAEAENLQSSDCDLTRRLPKMSGGLGRLTAGLNGFVGQLHDLVIEVSSRSGDIADAASQVSAGSVDLSARTEEQASTLEETASSMEEFTMSIKQVAAGTKRAAELTDAAVIAAERGAKVAANAVTKIEAANDSARRIGSIVSTIDSIAFQTNILALNAAVEAARAGEQGKGFAVVAAEVRALAQRSAASAREIKGLISDTTSKVDEGAALVVEAGEAIKGIAEAIRGAAGIVEDIAVSTREQANGIEQVNGAIVQMEGVTQQNAALVEEASAAAEAMRDQAAALVKLVARFKVKRDAGAPAAPPPSVSPTLRPAAQRVIRRPLTRPLLGMRS
jgi:methyl-accepting chemotaxis protein